MVGALIRDSWRLYAEALPRTLEQRARMEPLEPIPLLGSGDGAGGGVHQPGVALLVGDGHRARTRLPPSSVQRAPSRACDAQERDEAAGGGGAAGGSRRAASPPSSWRRLRRRRLRGRKHLRPQRPGDPGAALTPAAGAFWPT